MNPMGYMYLNGKNENSSPPKKGARNTHVTETYRLYISTTPNVLGDSCGRLCFPPLIIYGGNKMINSSYSRVFLEA